MDSEETEIEVCNCEDCGNAFDKDSAEYADDQGPLCETCYSRYTGCYDCGTILHENVMIYQGRRPYCETCFSDNFFNCESCGEDWPHSEHAQDGMCNGCYQDEYGSGPIMQYDYKPDLNFVPNIGGAPKRGLLYLGVELETERGGSVQGTAEMAGNLLDTGGRKKFFCKYDGSLDDGFEIVTHPMILKEHKKASWGVMLRQLRAAGYRSHNGGSCGLHVHVNRTFFTQVEIVKLGLFLYSNLGHLEALARRGPEEYTKTPVKLKNAHITDSNDRYEAINFTNSATVEFRMFRGTLKQSSFFATLELVDAICRYVKTLSIERAKADDKWPLFVQWLASNPKKYAIILEYISIQLTPETLEKVKNRSEQRIREVSILEETLSRAVEKAKRILTRKVVRASITWPANIPSNVKNNMVTLGINYAIQAEKRRVEKDSYSMDLSDLLYYAVDHINNKVRKWKDKQAEIVRVKRESELVRTVAPFYPFDPARRYDCEEFIRWG